MYIYLFVIFVFSCGFFSKNIFYIVLGLLFLNFVLVLKQEIKVKVCQGSAVPALLLCACLSSLSPLEGATHPGSSRDPQRPLISFTADLGTPAAGLRRWIVYVGSLSADWYRSHRSKAFPVFSWPIIYLSFFLCTVFPCSL